ncbi:MAG: manganese transporter [Dehalococcoidia bacterium]|nr:MAG: manganese transporter [Dehalococcoidia bacterium]
MRRALLLLALLALGGCAPLQAQPREDLSRRTIRVMATTGMVADLVRAIGGDRIEVSALMGPGVDPHLYKPTAGEVRRLEAADLIVYNGLELEGRMTDTFAKLARAGRPTFAVTEEIPEERLRAPPEFEGKYDPHVWFDVSLWRIAARTVARHLSQLDPSSAARYQANLSAYDQQLEALDRYLAEQAALIPPRARVLVTAHDAFGYFGARYGFAVRGLQGVSTATEASAADVRELAAFLCSRGIKAVFIESSIPPAAIEAVQRAAQANGCSVGLGGELYSDALGPEGSPAGTYLGMLRHNIDTIVRALR